MSGPRLKLCPFCGGKPKEDCSRYGNGDAYAWIECAECGTSTKRFKISLDYSARGKAEEVWNRRAE